eukprot:CAMPEP_0203848776 /NCGR_PEP_ID=MMETSP0359-20131031/5796_1 /ASSEMBLY_ACC=CAM_ASM_000338 /TAXON_ID=268821 /ORGANISM="Scrippsiella Hangoei, Strain SHTV-5" /LENGTH=138 /DNA_ID=CAMNT_0050764423 /DNA_START=756 /DNA_END=1172 /DNA_ORIENTATION=+
MVPSSCSPTRLDAAPGAASAALPAPNGCMRLFPEDGSTAEGSPHCEAATSPSPPLLRIRLDDTGGQFGEQPAGCAWPSSKLTVGVNERAKAVHLELSASPASVSRDRHSTKSAHFSLFSPAMLEQRQKCRGGMLPGEF